MHAGKCTEFEGDLQTMLKWLREARQQLINSQNAVQQQNLVASQNTAAKVDKEAQRKKRLVVVK